MREPRSDEQVNAAREIWTMRRSLAAPLDLPAWPAALQLDTWRSQHAPAIHALLVEGYRHGGGEVEPYLEWYGWFTSDPEFEPASCFLAWSGANLLGVALCWSSAFVKDLCVAESARRRGVASALLGQVLRHFSLRGEPAVELKLRSDNPSGAPLLYRKLGFARV